MKRIVILGSTGMLGSAVLEVFSGTGFDIKATTRNTLDAQKADIKEISAQIEGCDYAINCIGIIKPYIDDKNTFEVQRAIEVNGLFPHRLAAAAEKTGTKIIQIATDCVYDGKKGNYIETDKHNATDVYGKTKSLGEVIHPNVINLRCSIIGKEKKGKTSLLEWFLNQPKNAELNGFLNHHWNGVTTTAFAKIALGITKQEQFPTGLQHIIPANIMHKAGMLKVFAETFGRNDIKITDVNAAESIDRTISTTNPKINEMLWKNAGYKTIPTIEEMIAELEK